MDAEMTLEDFANQTPAERTAYLASVDASLTRRRLALGDAKPAAAAIPSPIDVTAIVEEAMASARKPAATLVPLDPNAEAEALAASIVGSAALATGTKPPTFAPASTPAVMPTASPNAEVEALAASIVASAALASGEGVSGPSDIEALAREIAAAAPQGA